MKRFFLILCGLLLHVYVLSQTKVTVRNATRLEMKLVGRYAQLETLELQDIPFLETDLLLAAGTSRQFTLPKDFPKKARLEFIGVYTNGGETSTRILIKRDNSNFSITLDDFLPNNATITSSSGFLLEIKQEISKERPNFLKGLLNAPMEQTAFNANYLGGLVLINPKDSSIVLVLSPADLRIPMQPIEPKVTSISRKYYANTDLTADLGVRIPGFGNDLQVSSNSLYSVNVVITSGWVNYKGTISIADAVSNMPDAAAAQIDWAYRNNPNLVCRRIIGAYVTGGAYSAEKMERIQSGAKISAASIVTGNGNFVRSLEQAVVYSVPYYVHGASLQAGEIGIWEIARNIIARRAKSQDIPQYSTLSVANQMFGWGYTEDQLKNFARPEKNLSNNLMQMQLRQKLSNLKIEGTGSNN